MSVSARVFPVNLGEVFDLVNVPVPIGPRDAKANVLDDANITTLAIEVPIACLTGVSAVIGGRTTAWLPRTAAPRRARCHRATIESGDFVQVSRLGMPLVNELVIGLRDKNKFNASQPAHDLANFATYVTNPTLPEILELLFGAARCRFPTTSRAPTWWRLRHRCHRLNQLGRRRDAAAQHFGCATAAGAQSNLGLLGGDNAGFPNGRRPGDDVVDIELGVAMGVVCHAFPASIASRPTRPAACCRSPTRRSRTRRSSTPCSHTCGLRSRARPTTGRGVGASLPLPSEGSNGFEAASLLIAIAVAALRASPPLFAHDLWIAPSSFTPALGEPIRLQLVLADGERIETLPRNDAGIVRFVAVGPGGDQPVAGLDGLDPAGFLRPPEPGWYTILYQSSPALTDARSRHFPRLSAGEGELDAGRRAGRERTGAAHHRALPPLDQVAHSGRRSGWSGDRGPGEAHPRVCRSSSYRARSGRRELAAEPAERDVVVRLLLDGAPLDGALVEVRRLDDRVLATSATTDGEGRVRLRLGPGSWVATSVHLDPSRPATADWESLWSSMTFSLE